MRYHVSSKMKTRVEITHTLPEKYEKYRLPGAGIEFTRGPFGFFILQQLDTEYYAITQQHFMIANSIRLYPQVERPTVAISCILKGELMWMPGRVTSNESTYALHYIPGHTESRAYFKKGFYEIINFELQEAYLRFFIHDHPQLARMHDYMVAAGEEGIQLSCSNINMYVREQIVKIRKTNPSIPGYRIFIRNRINDILLQYLQDLNDADNNDQLLQGKHQKLIMEIGEYLKFKLDRTITIKELAEGNNIHIKTLMREFKKYHGVTIPEFVHHHRMAAVVQLLMDSDMPIYKIADKLGFVDVPHLAKTFKSKYQMTPSEYRQNRKAVVKEHID